MKKPSYKIKNIKLNSQQELMLNKDDIVVIVGGNNTGKSKILKEISSITSNMKITNEIILDNLEFYDFDTTEEELKEYLLSNMIMKKEQPELYQGFGKEIHISYIRHPRVNSNWYIQNIFVNLVKTEDRLTISNPSEKPSYNGFASNPLQIIANNSDLSKKIFDAFYKAFSINLSLDTITTKDIIFKTGGNSIESHIAFNKAEQALREYYNSLEPLINQGDGMKSFVGVLLSIVQEPYSIILLDEPESFLHPPQARIVGQTLAEMVSNDKQLIISTHSIEIINGLLSVAPKRVKIVNLHRIYENGREINKIHILDNEMITNLLNDSIFKHSNILNGIFHDRVIVCESDSDSQMYSIICNHELNKRNKFNNDLYVNVGGKHRISMVCNGLKGVGVLVTAIVDIDILNEKETFRKLLTSFTIDWSSIEERYSRVVEYVGSKKKNTRLKILKNKIDQIITNSKLSDSDFVDKTTYEKLKELAKEKIGWDELKKQGFEYLNDENIKNDFTYIYQLLLSKGLVIVKHGELENLIKSKKSLHGPKWVNHTLDKYNDLDNPIYNDIKVFLREIRFI